MDKVDEKIFIRIAEALERLSPPRKTFENLNEASSYLWKASLETINFMPLSSTDPFAGTIITDWYTSESNTGERCKLNIFINGIELKTDNLKVLSFCQNLKNNQWVNKISNQEDNLKLENAILNKAKKLKLISG